MTIEFSKSFKKHYQKLPKPIQEKAKTRLQLFRDNIFHPVLRNHELEGKYLDHRSINITGDYRAVYRKITETLVEFVDIGTHAQLYE